MTVTVLAVIFILFILAITFFGFKYLIRQGHSGTGTSFETCSVCKNRLERTQLVERQVGDSRLLFFCGSCVQSLHKELMSRN